MKYTQLQAAITVLVSGACSQPAGQPRVIGPRIGESTAPGPADPFVPPPDAAGATELSVRLHGRPGPGAKPASTTDTTSPPAEPTPTPTVPPSRAPGRTVERGSPGVNGTSPSTPGG